MFGALNTINVANAGDSDRFNRGSFFFRRAEWSRDEMVEIMLDAATRATHYYISVYGEDAFERLTSQKASTS